MGVIITIGGAPGSGKSTLGRSLAEKLGVPFFSLGEIRREYAQKHGMTLQDLNRISESDPTTDKMIDEYQASLPEKNHSFVLDSRLGFHFLPKSIKIYIKVDRKVAAERSFHERRKTERWHSVEGGISSLEIREMSDKHRFKQYYSLDPSDESQYDLVLDSSSTTNEELLEQALGFLKKRGITK